MASVDKSLRQVLKARSFPLQTQSGVGVGQVSFSDDGASAWGFSRTVSVLGAEPDDLLSVRVDLVDQVATVGLESPEALDIH